MRARTAVVAALVLLVLGVVVAFGVAQFVVGGATVSERWVSDTARDITSNHHAPAVAAPNGTSTVYAPISDADGAEGCGLLALDAGDGGQEWEYPVSPANCTIHAVADPTVADVEGDGRLEVVAATTEEAVVVFDARTGEEQFRHDLGSYGYTRPRVADLDGDGTREIVAVDVRGGVSVLGPDGDQRWADNHDAYAWATPVVADVDADGEGNVVVGLETGVVQAYRPDGTVLWNATGRVGGPVTWMTRVDDPDRQGSGVVTATAEGTVTLLEGANGSAAWQRDFGDYAAVHAAGDGDGDGRPEVYVVARDGVLRSLDAGTGTVEWTTTLTTEDVQMMPPPTLGDLDDDGELELVAPGNDGVVSVVDPATGEVLGSYERSVPVYTHPTVADVDGDGAEETFVVYGDGRVVSLSFSAS